MSELADDLSRAWRLHDRGEYARLCPVAEALLARIEPDHELRASAVGLAASARLMTGDAAGALELADEELRRAERRGRPTARLHFTAALVRRASGAHDEAFAQARAGEAAAAREGAEDVATDCVAHLCRWFAEGGDLAEARRCLDRASEAPSLPPRTRAAVLLARGDLETAEGRVDEADETWLRLARLARDHDLPHAEASALHALGRSARLRGDRPAALDRLRAARLLAEKVGSGLGVARVANELGELCRTLGRLDEAEEAYTQALAHLGAGMPEITSVFTCNLALVRLARGDVDGAAADLRALLERNPARPILWALGFLGQIPALARAGDPAGIDASLEGAERWVPDVQAGEDDVVVVALQAAGELRADPTRAARVLALVADACVRVGDRAGADELQGRLRALARGGAEVPVGPFSLVTPIGRGASSTVWLAQHAGRRVQVALKVLHPHASLTPQLVRAELEAVARLDHPHIVWLLDHGQIGEGAAALEPSLAPGAPWLAVELVPGGTLAEVAGRLEWPACRRILVQLLDALAHAHARGVLHLDVKPNNVLLGGDPRFPTAKLADFGLARALAGAEVALVAGSPGYMAPEQFVPGARLVPATDLYGLGCLAAALVQGAPPFLADSVDELRVAHSEVPVPALKATHAVPAGFDGWLRTLLAKSAGARFPSAASAAAALRALPEAAGASVVRASPAPLPADETLVLEQPSGEGTIAPLPTAWRTGALPARPGDVVDAGLGLFALRAPPLVGRRNERERLWDVLRDAVAAGGSRLALLVAAPGHGGRAVARWLVERAAEVGVEVRWLDPDPIDVLGDLAAGPPGLRVAVLADPPAGLLADPRVSAVPVGPLPDADLAAALDERLPLAPELRDALVRHAGGHPGRATEVLRSWVRDHRLVRRAHGWALRPGTPFPE